MKNILRIIHITSFILIMFYTLGIISSCINESETFKVKFDLAGGTAAEKVEYDCKNNQVLVLFEPTKEGYKFIGWKLDDDIIKTDTIAVTCDMHFIAVWESLSYHITLDMNTSELDNEIIEVKQNEHFTLPIPKRYGYNFMGWHLDDQLFNESIYQENHDITLVAKWETIKINVTYYIDGVVYNKENIEYGEKIVLPTPSKIGHTFLGWFLNDQKFDDGINYEIKNIDLIAKFEKNTYKLTLVDKEEITYDIQYQDEIHLPVLEKIGYQFLGWYLDDVLYDYNVFEETSDIILHAKWKKIEYQIILLDSNISPISIYYGDEINLPVLEKVGYKFLGWYENDIKFEDKVWTRLESITLHAKWEKELDDDLTLINSFDILYYNMQTDEYNQISIFKVGSSISASLYWHKIGIVETDGKYYVSGIASSGQNLSSISYYDYIILAYSSYNRYSEFSSMNLQVGDLVSFNLDLNTLSRGSVELKVSFYHETKPLPSLDEIKEFFDMEYGAITEVNDSLDLITSYKGYFITWSTSNQDIISISGEYSKPYVTREVELKAFIDGFEVYNFSFKVKGEHEESTALATGYFYTNFSKITENTIKNLDIMYCSFAYVNTNGEFTNTSLSSTFIKNIQNYVLPLAKKYGTKVVISVNEENGAFGPIAMSEELTKKLAINIVNLINILGLDGIDIDWEYPTVEETPYFTTMMKAIYEAVKNNNPNHLVTAAIAGGKWQPPRYDLVNSAKYLDYINLMTYSMTSNNGQFQNPLYKSSKGYTLTSCSIDESVAIYDSYGVPRSKLLVGLSFYGVKQSGSNGPGTASTGSSSITFSAIYQNYLMNPDPNIIIGFDEESVSPYIYDPINKIFISYENERSIARKCEYVNTLGLGGVMYWQDGQDYQDILLNAVCENIRK